MAGIFRGYANILLIITVFLSDGRFKRMEVLKVSAKSNPNSVAGALAGVLRERGAAEIQAIGAGALNQAVKAVAIARGFVAPSGVDLICIPAFTDIVIDGEERTAIKLIVEPR
jgi:stage V sporulation protein S